MEFLRGSTNVYADLGVPDADGCWSRRRLATKIGEIIKRRRLTQVGGGRDRRHPAAISVRPCYAAGSGTSAKRRYCNASHV